MIHESQCVECHSITVSEDDAWQPGQVCLFGMLFACSMKCAETYAAREAKEGYRPGEPYFDAEYPAGPVTSPLTNPQTPV